jgi:hypothetical protein
MRDADRMRGISPATPETKVPNTLIYLVGHNDAGYPCDVPPRAVPTLGTAIQCIVSDIQSYFLIEVSSEPDAELTPYDIRMFTAQAFNARPGSCLVFRGHQFWLRTEPIPC